MDLSVNSQNFILAYGFDGLFEDGLAHVLNTAKQVYSKF